MPAIYSYVALALAAPAMIQSPSACRSNVKLAPSNTKMTSTFVTYVCRATSSPARSQLHEAVAPQGPRTRPRPSREQHAQPRLEHTVLHTGRGALWRVRLRRRGNPRQPLEHGQGPTRLALHGPSLNGRLGVHGHAVHVPGEAHPAGSSWGPAVTPASGATTFAHAAAHAAGDGGPSTRPALGQGLPRAVTVVRATPCQWRSRRPCRAHARGPGAAVAAVERRAGAGGRVGHSDGHPTLLSTPHLHHTIQVQQPLRLRGFPQA